MYVKGGRGEERTIMDFDRFLPPALLIVEINFFIFPMLYQN